MGKKGDNRARYAALRAMKRCTQCGKQDAFTLNGRCYCAECAEWRKQYYNERPKTEEQRKRRSEYNKGCYNERKKNNLCPKCGRKVEPPYVMCARCRAKRAKLYEEKKPYIDPSMCSRCHKFPKLPYRTICANCYARALELSRMGADARRRKKDAASCNG